MGSRCLAVNKVTRRQKNSWCELPSLLFFALCLLAGAFMVMVMVMVIYSALVRSHQSTYEGSFGPVPPLQRWTRRLSGDRRPRLTNDRPVGTAGRPGGRRTGLSSPPTLPARRNAHFVVPRARGGNRCCIIWEATLCDPGITLLALGWGGVARHSSSTRVRLPAAARP